MHLCIYPYTDGSARVLWVLSYEYTRDLLHGFYEFYVTSCKFGFLYLCYGTVVVTCECLVYENRNLIVEISGSLLTVVLIQQNYKLLRETVFECRGNWFLKMGKHMMKMVFKTVTIF